MAKPEKIVESLNKLYEKRAVLDRQILETEKNLLSAVSIAPATEKSVAAKKGASRKRTPVARKQPVKK